MKDGVEQYNIVYPKFMNGEAVVRTVPVKQNLGKFPKHMTSVLHVINSLNQKRYVQYKVVKHNPPLNRLC